jgi:hypothetical protein
MMKTNLLDLDYDILNIIGDYVKKDNLEKERMVKFKQDVFEYVDIQMKEDRNYIRKRSIYMSRYDTKEQIWWYSITFKHKFFGRDVIEDDKCKEIMNFFNEYLTLKKLNLKKAF